MGKPTQHATRNTQYATRNTFQVPRFTFHPWHVVLAVLLLYVGLILALNGGDPLAFATIGTRFAEHDPEGVEGYDGQFVYFVATDPAGAPAYLDVPAYRFQRILLPLLARMLGLGQPALIAWALIGINVAAQTVGTALVERLLVGAGVGRWYALTYGLWAGLVHAVRLDLHEPLSYALLAAALLTHQCTHNAQAAVLGGVPYAGDGAESGKEVISERLGWTVLFFALATFTKETALVFVGAYLAWALFNRRWRVLVAVGLGVGAPYAAWQAWLYQAFGAFGLGSGGALATPFEIVPFMGVWRIGLVNVRVLLVFLLFLAPLYILPALLGIWAAARTLWQHDWHLWVWTLGANVALIPFTPFSTFREPWAMLRFGTGLVFAWLLFAAHCRSEKMLRRSTYWISALVFLIQG